MTLSGSLLSAAAKAEARAQEAIADGDPEAAEVAMKNAAHFRRLATNHRAKVILTGDLSHNPAQITDPPGDITGDEIHARRSALGMSQTDLAQRLDVTPTTLARWERGESPVAHPAMLRLALDALARDQS